ncbi:hypothetical protein GS979_06760 [Rhodococcus hoagii]|nr:hypothetical protein [Prescottella equi]NKW46115.1 hypothetical protein [Prescottella equi]
MTRHLDAPDVQIGQALTHIHQLDPSTRDRLFHLADPVTDSDTRERLAVALGAALYMPGNRPGLADTIVCRWMRCGSGGGLIRLVGQPRWRPPQLD